MSEGHDRTRSTVGGDPSGIEHPHDVLAAEEFVIGTRDERFPADPSGIHGPHDTLAAEEFAMPAGVEPHEARGAGRQFPLALALLAVALLLLVRRRAHG
jgi:MYXO-CTERM domain-containing protein